MTQKNNVSYFMAGYRAGMIDSGAKKSDVDRRFYSGLVYPNRARELLREYNSQLGDKEGLEAMGKLAMKKRMPRDWEKNTIEANERWCDICNKPTHKLINGVCEDCL